MSRDPDPELDMSFFNPWRSLTQGGERTVAASKE